jgi:primosomal protein N' (replication factor Y)
MYVDVAFPNNMPPLTYKLHKDASYDLIGRLVKAPLRQRDSFGLILNVKNSHDVDKTKEIKKISHIYGHFISEKYFLLLKWLSDYYMNHLGNVLKNIPFLEIISAILNAEIEDSEHKEVISDVVCDKEIKPIYDLLRTGKYGTFLFRADSLSKEKEMLKEIFSALINLIKGAIILVPEVHMIEEIAPILRETLDERLCVYHSRLNKKNKINTLNSILSGQKDIVLGTRSAILVPLKRLSFIAVLGEHSQSYKAEEGMRYNGRDVAVRRGFIEKIPVLLSSICPSLESIYNTKIGKYVLINAKNDFNKGKPKVKIVDERNFLKKNIVVSPVILKEARKIKEKKGRFLFLVNKKGYSFLKCDDCGSFIRCRNCNISMTFFKDEGLVRCLYCGFSSTVPDICDFCKGFNIIPSGFGIDKVKEEIGKDFKLSDLSFILEAGYKKKRLKDGDFLGATFFNIDMTLAMPDFRVQEKVFQDFIQLSEIIRPDGYIFIQTRNPEKEIFKFMRTYDINGFYKTELCQRKELKYPPFSRIVLLSLFIRLGKERYISEIEDLIRTKRDKDIDILGPVEVPSKRLNIRRMQILLKSIKRELLHKVSSQFLDRFKNLKGIKIKVDVDPIKIF